MRNGGHKLLDVFCQKRGLLGKRGKQKAYSILKKRMGGMNYHFRKMNESECRVAINRLIHLIEEK